MIRTVQIFEQYVSSTYSQNLQHQHEICHGTVNRNKWTYFKEFEVLFSVHSYNKDNKQDKNRGNLVVSELLKKACNGFNKKLFLVQKKPKSYLCLQYSVDKMTILLEFSTQEKIETKLMHVLRILLMTKFSIKFSDL